MITFSLRIQFPLYSAILKKNQITKKLNLLYNMKRVLDLLLNSQAIDPATNRLHYIYNNYPTAIERQIMKPLESSLGLFSL